MCYHADILDLRTLFGFDSVPTTAKHLYDHGNTAAVVPIA